MHSTLSALTALTTITALTALTTISAPAQAQSFGAMDAPASQARTPLPVKVGRVLDIQQVTIDVPADSGSNMLGGVIGATAGAFLARESGWQGQALAGSLGAAAGSRAGQMLGAEKKPAQQVIVQLDSGGDPIAIIQEPGSAPLSVGEKIYLIGSGNTVRAVAARP